MCWHPAPLTGTAGGHPFKHNLGHLLFARIYNDIKHETWWKQRPKATVRLQAHPLQKLVSAFCALADGEGMDRPDEYVRLSKTTVTLATKRLVASILCKYHAKYLRAPTNEDPQKMTRRKERGLPSCMGSLACSHWEWSNYPTAHAGMYL